MEVFTKTFTDRVTSDIGGMLLKVNYRPVGPRWMEIANKEEGTTEIKGPTHNERIIEYHSTAGGRTTDDDDDPWCSSYVNWVMEEAKYTGTGSAASQSWRSWKGGQKIDKPVYGAICVIDYTYKNKPGKGHVGFVVGQDEKGVWLLGGNQGGEAFGGGTVKVSKYTTTGIEKYFTFLIPKGYVDEMGPLGPYKGQADEGSYEKSR